MAAKIRQGRGEMLAAVGAYNRRAQAGAPGGEGGWGGVLTGWLGASHAVQLSCFFF